MNYSDFLDGKRIVHPEAGFRDAMDIDLNSGLFDWQAQLVRWALRVGRADLWCDSGLGKTFMQLEWARVVNERTNKKVLILTPLAVAGQTHREGDKFGIETTVCKSMADVKPGINIANYERLEKFDPNAFGALVCDESSILKSYEGSTRKAITEFADRLPYRLGCSATPAPNDVMELGTQSEFVGSLTRAEMLATFFVHDGGETSKWRLKRHAEHMKDLMKAEVNAVRVGGVEVKQREESGAGWRAKLGDCVESLRGEPDQSVGYSVFSPPFASLYTYSDSLADMGNCRSHADFFEHMKYLVAEIFRVLQDGRLVSFHCMNLPKSKERDGVIGITDFRGQLIRLFEDHGFIFHSEVCIWKDPVTAMQRTKAIGLLYKQLRKDSTISRQGIADYLVTMRKPGVNTSPVTKTHESFPVGLWQNYASPVWMDINPSDTLTKEGARENEDERHICPLQLEVIRRAIRLWSNPDDVVMSPFMGIGSEGYVSIESGRRFLGCELKESYYNQAVANLKVAHQHNGMLFEEAELQEVG